MPQALVPAGAWLDKLQRASRLQTWLQPARVPHLIVLTSRRNYVHLPHQDARSLGRLYTACEDFVVLHRVAIKLLGFPSVMFHDSAIQSCSGK